jgi:hypothetical protein
MSTYTDEQKQYLRETLAATDDRNNVLDAWLGESRVVEGSWPNNEREPFIEALVAQGVADGRLVDDRDDPLFPDDERIHMSAAAYVAALVIE